MKESLTIAAKHRMCILRMKFLHFINNLHVYIMRRVTFSFFFTFKRFSVYLLLNCLFRSYKQVDFNFQSIYD